MAASDRTARPKAAFVYMVRCTGGQLYTGCNGIAGEIGHMVIRKDGEPCNCGRRGCLEAYCSAASLVRFAERALEDGRKSVLAVHKGQLNAKQICDAVDAGDALAQELFDETFDEILP